MRVPRVLPRFSARVPSTTYAISATTFAQSQPRVPSAPICHASHSAEASSTVSITCGMMRTHRCCSRCGERSIHAPRSANSETDSAAALVCTALIAA